MKLGTLNAFTPYTLALCTLLLSACGDAVVIDEGPSDTDDQADYNNYVAARNDALSVASAIAADEIVLSGAPANDTAQLSGAYAISSDATPDAAIVGEMDMSVDFGAETVSGILRNNFIDGDGTGESNVTDLDGTITFSGSVDMDPTGGFYDSTNTTAWQVAADAEGVLTDGGTSDSLDETIYSLDAEIFGAFYDTSGIGDIDGVGTVGDIGSAGIIEGNLDVTTADDTVLYDITGDSFYNVYETAD